MSSLNESIADFCSRLQAIEIPYTIGGSVASGIWGEPRYTNDVDIGIWLLAQDAQRFAAAFPDPYLVSVDDLTELSFGSHEYHSVQVLHTEEALKFDCFIVPIGDPYAAECLKRSKTVEILPGRNVRVAAPEDIFVHKLRWFQLGNRSSERQWRDLQGIVRQQEDLDWEFIDRWAKHFGVNDLAAELKP